MKKKMKKKKTKVRKLKDVKPYVPPVHPDREGDPDEYAEKMQSDIRAGRRKIQVAVVGGVEPPKAEQKENKKEFEDL
jgi:hypothetical protein